MPRFYTGDELGNIKAIQCSQIKDEDCAWTLEARIIHPSTHTRTSTIQKLVHSESGNDHTSKLAAASSDGSVSALLLKDDGSPQVLCEWKDTRFKSGHTFVGLAASASRLFWCTSNGAFGQASLPDQLNADISDAPSPFTKATLPMRLCDWRLSPSAAAFAYGGNEVEVSVWDIERAFAAPGATSCTDVPTPGKKRKRGDDLLPAETWRAKNVPNDYLGLRQPLHVTSLSYLSTGSGIDNHIIASTQHGHVRRYDTRAARRPVADWANISKSGVSVIEAGLGEYELFAADNGSNLLALDLRNGRIAYSFKKIAGTVNSIAPSPGQFLASTSNDRFFRLHSTFPPPDNPSGQQENKGEVLGSLFMKSTPTTVVCDYRQSMKTYSGSRSDGEVVDEEGDDDVWAGMAEIDDGEDANDGNRSRQHRRKTR